MSGADDERLDALVEKHSERFKTRKRTDIELAAELFEGFITRDRKQLPEQQFLKGDDETEAREALARLLRSDEPLDKLLRILLAGQIDGRPYAYKATRGPDASISQELLPRRRLTFTAPRGRVRQDQKELKIGSEILALLDNDRNLTVTAAIKEIADKYKLSTDRAWDAWEYMKKRGWWRRAL
jgi:hypothetical protein